MNHRDNLQFKKGAETDRPCRRLQHKPAAPMFANRTICGYTVPCVVFYILAVMFIILYGFFLRRTKTRDVLAKQIYHHPICQEIDGWSITHLVFFGILGFLYPGQHLQFLVVGVLWEIIETGLGQNKLEVSGKRLQLIGEQDSEGNPTGKEDAYWYGKESDIVMDVTGYTIGSFLADKWWPNDRTQGRGAPPGR